MMYSQNGLIFLEAMIQQKQEQLIINSSINHYQWNMVCESEFKTTTSILLSKAKKILTAFNLTETDYVSTRAVNRLIF